MDEETQKILKILIEHNVQNQIRIIELLETMDWKLWEILQTTRRGLGEDASNSSKMDRK